VYLSALTLKGFKSFASSTTLRFERGITCVVGPNGSGKSNVVDAISWVLGEQGARTLRGGSMADVIFAGTAARSPLGRAEVSLTFDNSDGSIPEGAAEVTVTRTMFRSGGSDYAINGRSCRLLDIQDMLGDAGIGRELHVLVGQGRVDAVLSATPQERRLFLEEAAGVIKHRRRKEKALRKLAAMDGNLVRLADVTSEVARQLKPLGRQARTARRARRFAADARDARLRLLADDLAAATAAMRSQDPEDGVPASLRLGEVERRLTEADTARSRAAAAVSEAAPGVAGWREATSRGIAVHERLRSIVRLAEDRISLLQTQADAVDAVDPAVAEQAALAARSVAADLETQVGAAQDEVRDLGRRRIEAENAHAAAELEATARARARAKARDDVALAQAALSSGEARLESVDAEAARARLAVAHAQARHDEALAEDTGEVEREPDLPATRNPVATQGLPATQGLSTTQGPSTNQGLPTVDDPAVDERQPDVGAAEARLAACRDAHVAALSAAREADGVERAADHRLASARAMTEALAALAAPADATAFVTQRHPAARPVSSALGVVPGHEVAIAAALGATADAVVLGDLTEAASATSAVAGAGAGRVSIVIPGENAAAAMPTGDLPSHVRPARSLLTGNGVIADWARGRLNATVVTDDLDSAVAAVTAAEHLTAVTMAGDVVTIDTLHGGAPPAATSLQRVADLAGAEQAMVIAEREWQVARAAATRARAAAEAAEWDLEDARNAQAAVSADVVRIEQRRAAAVAKVEQHRAAAQARVTAATGDVRRASAAAEQVDRRRDELAADVERKAARVADLLAAAAARQEDAGEDATPDVIDLARVARQAREDETAARLGLRTLEERLSGARRDATTAAAAAAAAAVASRAAQEEFRRTRMAFAVAGEVRRDAATAIASAARVRTVALDAREAQQSAHDAAAAAHAAAAAELESLTAERATLADRVHAEALARTEHRMRLDALTETAMADFGFAVDDLLEQYGPHLPVPLVPDTAFGAPDVEDDWPHDDAAAVTVADPPPPDSYRTSAYDRAEQTRRLRAAEKALAQLGSINPLAMEEYASLEERHRFLLQQQQDLTDSKRDLMSIIRDVDERVEQVVAEAFLDTAAHFAGLVARLFPGGAGRLVLTDPDDLLNAGIEVEARPAGKSVKRLSLLSGGERTLVALAFLIALFKARPSPFYVLDEIEAALDDTNLTRLVGILGDLRETSQLLVITHQRRTMEAADALYGVTMRGDGVSTVISQRLRDTVGS